MSNDDSLENFRDIAEQENETKVRGRGRVFYFRKRDYMEEFSKRRKDGRIEG